jgi:hypothetical protein
LAEEEEERRSDDGMTTIDGILIKVLFPAIKRNPVL